MTSRPRIVSGMQPTGSGELQALAPIQIRADVLHRELAVLERGAEHAGSIAQRMVTDVRDAMGMKADAAIR